MNSPYLLLEIQDIHFHSAVHFIFLFQQEKHMVQINKRKFISYDKGDEDIEGEKF